MEPLSDKLRKMARNVKAVSFVNPFNSKDLGRDLDVQELTRVIRLAIASELEAIHLYETIADAIPHGTFANVLFRDVADEEKVHVGEFEELLRKFDGDQKKLNDEGILEAQDMYNSIREDDYHG